MSRENTATFERALDSLESCRAVSRIWARDHTLWSENPAEIANRLGWLDITTAMRAEVPTLAQLAHDVRDQDIRHIVLLGMGGSSLGAETLRRCFGPHQGWPELVVLDSTLPARIKSVSDSVDIARTLFLVSSKSGATVEPNLLYRYFRNMIRAAGGGGDSFVAITDPGSPLERLARRERFRKTFLNPPDVCGRYSVLGYFGLVPASLAGYDIPTILDSADAMRDRCAAGVPTRLNPGAWLGAAIASLANAGIDKLTLLTSPTLASFGLWAEQLIAESLGKNGRGIIPVTAEPHGEISLYGNDRQFAFLKMRGEDSEADRLIQDLACAGHPVIRYEIEDLSALGGEFYRWEFAVATAAALIGVHPFNQPDVDGAKRLAQLALDSSASPRRSSRSIRSADSLSGLLSGMKPGDYLAILAYIPQTTQNDAALSRLRLKILNKYKIPTTLGYGPRYLHSTGQLHKGGPNSVAALMITSPHTKDIPVPDESFTFGELTDAQSLSDLQALQDAGRRTACITLDEVLAAPNIP